jgi:hypothetical protein
VFWMTAEVIATNKLQFSFDLYEQTGTKIKKKIAVDRVFDVYRIRVYYSHVALTEALHRNEEYIASELIRTLQAQYADEKFKTYRLEKEIADLKSKNVLLAQETETFKQKTKMMAYEYFVKGYKLHYAPKFDFSLTGKTSLTGRIGKGVDAWGKMLILSLVGLIALFIFTYWGLPVFSQIIGDMTNVSITINDGVKQFFMWTGIGLIVLFIIIFFIKLVD